MGENTEKVRGNPILPDPPIPSQVRMSMVPEPPTPIPKVLDEEEVGEGEDGMTNAVKEVAPRISSEKLRIRMEMEEEMDVKPKGIIVIKVFENSPYEVEFSGVVIGSEVDMAWKAMMKEYRVWKHNLFKKETEAKIDGGV